MSRTSIVIGVALVAGAAACNQGIHSDTTTATETGAGTNDASEASDASEAATDTEGETTAGTDTEGAPQVVRFIAFGDGGEGNEAQYQVASVVEQVCAERGCDFAVYLGDNFYDNGVVSVDDTQFQDKFELPYQDLGFRFYVVLGNHDYGEVLPDWTKSSYEIEYTQYSDKWYLPAEWYTFTVEHVQFFALDTHRQMMGETLQDQRAWMAGEIGSSSAQWKIALAHHPYISNGAHGNAGTYEGLDTTLLAGKNVKAFLDDFVCGQANVFFSGHDHTRQWLEPTCGTQFIVSGAAAKTTSSEHRDNNPVYYEDDQEEGFMWVEIVDDRMTGVFYDRDGNIDFEKSITLGEW